MCGNPASDTMLRYQALQEFMQPLYKTNNIENVNLIHLGTVLIISIVDHGHCPLLPVLDAWGFLCIKKAGLVPIEFANHTKHEGNCVPLI